MPTAKTTAPGNTQYQSFVMRVSLRQARDPGKGGPSLLAVRVHDVNQNVSRTFSSTQAAYVFMSKVIDRFTLNPSI